MFLFLLLLNKTIILVMSLVIFKFSSFFVSWLFHLKIQNDYLFLIWIEYNVFIFTFTFYLFLSLLIMHITLYWVKGIPIPSMEAIIHCWCFSCQVNNKLFFQRFTKKRLLNKLCYVCALKAEGAVRFNWRLRLYM